MESTRRVEALRAVGAANADIQALELNTTRSNAAFEESFARFWPDVTRPDLVLGRLSHSPRAAGTVYRRVRNEGPMDGFGYSWFDDHLALAHLPRPRLLAREPDGEGAPFGYEALNLVDGHRSVGEIRDVLFATVGAAPVEEVAEYLDTLARLGVIEPVRP
jgi:hypothetical protein